VTTEPLGLAVVDKPPGITSHDVVAAVRRALGVRRVGHAGTLDPPATGVLLVGVGRATRLLRFLQGTDKAYEGTLVLGSATSTLDATGEVTGTYDMAGVSDEDVAGAAAALTGELDQVPPMVSAVQVGGRRLHELAREGIEVDRAARRVRVSTFVVAPLGDGTWRFVVECSSGTYVRSLADDLGRALGGGAHLASLRRTRVGRFGLDGAIPLSSFGTPEGPPTMPLLSPAAMVGHLGSVVVSADETVALVQGRTVRVPASGVPREVAALGEDRRLIAVCADGGDGVLRPSVVVATTGQPSRDD